MGKGCVQSCGFTSWSLGDIVSSEREKKKTTDYSVVEIR